MLVSKLTDDYEYYDNSAEKAKKAIAVLSQYKAQVSAVKDKLTEEGFEECTVRTVVASQGWFYQFVHFGFLMLISLKNYCW